MKVSRRLRSCIPPDLFKYEQYSASHDCSNEDRVKQHLGTALSLILFFFFYFFYFFSFILFNCFFFYSFSFIGMYCPKSTHNNDNFYSISLVFFSVPDNTTIALNTDASMNFNTITMCQLQKASIQLGDLQWNVLNKWKYGTKFFPLAGF